ncbi:MAG: ABC transporter ATP-binding protein [Lachnospiraceae bacterium]|nr:ABC transporter ATP-binding protein [Lachnospiraceae bacterium]
MNNILEVKDFSLAFAMYDGVFHRRMLNVITNLNITVGEGEMVAVAGSSGSGKSLLAHGIMGILPQNAVTGGSVLWRGQPMTPKLLKKIRGRALAFVPQSVTYLDPLIRVGRQITRDKGKLGELISRYHLKPEVARLYPHELSGGMTRRIMICAALAGSPELVVADEPTPGLSRHLAEHAMKHFREMADAGAGVLLVTHDIELAIRFADRIAVFYGGTTVETADAADFVNGDGRYPNGRDGGDGAGVGQVTGDSQDAGGDGAGAGSEPDGTGRRQGDGVGLRHPYSKALWAAMPQNGFVPTPGVQPYAGDLPAGCLYAPRCPMRTQACDVAPEPRPLRGGVVSCHHAV